MSGTNAIKWSVALGVGLMVFAIPVMAWACSTENGMSSLRIKDDEPTEEAEFPDEPVVLELEGLGRGSSDSLFNFNSSGCEGLGSLLVRANGYERDYGLLFRIKGTYPTNMRTGSGSGPIVLSEKYPRYNLVWWDTKNEPIDITMTAQWVDEYGRKGPTSEPLHIVDDGEGLSSGCASLNGSRSTPVILVLCLIGLVALRRERGKPAATCVAAARGSAGGSPALRPRRE